MSGIEGGMKVSYTPYSGQKLRKAVHIELNVRRSVGKLFVTPQVHIPIKFISSLGTQLIWVLIK